MLRKIKPVPCFPLSHTALALKLKPHASITAKADGKFEEVDHKNSTALSCAISSMRLP